MQGCFTEVEGNEVSILVNRFGFNIGVIAARVDITEAEKLAGKAGIN
jgi:hypothetical protein